MKIEYIENFIFELFALDFKNVDININIIFLSSLKRDNLRVRKDRDILYSFINIAFKSNLLFTFLYIRIKIFTKINNRRVRINNNFIKFNIHSH